MPPDNRYRDMCVAGADLDQSDFDPTTGEVMEDDITGVNPGSSSPSPLPTPGQYTPDWTQFHQKFTGTVSGAKPPLGHCMPMRDTKKIPLTYQTIDVPNHNLAFAYFMNMDDECFSPPCPGATSKSDVYKSSNAYRSQTFFIGGQPPPAPAPNPYLKLYCPDILEPATPFPAPVNPPTDPTAIPQRAWMQKLKAENCYNYYILNHSANPWFTMERPGVSTDDPLSEFDPERAYLNSCQPLINGTRAEQVTFAYWRQLAGVWVQGDPTPSDIEKKSGFAPVWQYIDRPDADEAEYLLSTYLQREWDKNFVTGITDPNIATRLNQQIRKNYRNIPLPCVQRVGMSTPTTPVFPLPSSGSSTPPAPSTSCPSSSGSSGAGGPCQNQHLPLPYTQYNSPGTAQPYYCPNVERITEPSHPYSPRTFMVQNTIAGANINLFDQKYDNDTKGYLTDRDYSWETSRCLRDCQDGFSKRGYTTYHPYDCETGAAIQGSPFVTDDGSSVDPVKQTRNPIVQCAMVPVDVLEFRHEAFNTCIMQRINYNFNKWMDAGFPPADSFVPPCKTKFWETDQATDPSSTDDYCPLQMSIQQCCRIIIKDVVPANFIKFRTCENLMQKRLDDVQLQTDLAVGTPPRAYVNDERFIGTTDNCPPGFPGCISMGGGPVSGPNPQPWHITLARYDQARLYTELLNDPAANRQCGRVPTGSSASATDPPTEPDEYLFLTHFAGFSYPEFDPPGQTTTYTWKFLGYHMPYMRWWDTGVSAGNPKHGGSFLNTLGGFDTIIGVGREERYKKLGELLEDDLERFETSQSGTPADQGGDLIDRLKYQQQSEMGRIGGWNELKAHEMWSMRRSNLFCIGRYEKLFKPGGAEQLVLSKAGSGYTSMDFKQWPWTLGWRGYVTDDHRSSSHYNFPRFPKNTGNPTAARLVGLDEALPGDIIVYEINKLKHIAYVTDIGFDVQNRRSAVFDYNTGKFTVGGNIIYPNRVFVVSWDQGKFPTSAGSTLNWGMGPERTIYKTRVPRNYSESICDDSKHYFRSFTYLTAEDPVSGANLPEPYGKNCKVDPLVDCKAEECQPSCEDPSYTACVLPEGIYDWDKVVIYRPSWDIRRCTGMITSTASTAPGNLDLGATYDWTGFDPANPGIPPAADPRVIYQSMTSLVGTDLWSYCVNSGWDPPSHYNKEYRGAQTGAMTDTTLCGPKWNEQAGSGPAAQSGVPARSGCSATPDAETKFFPKGSGSSR